MKTLTTLVLGIGMASMGPGTLPAQTGPWTDGELLIRSQLQPAGPSAIFRVVPETGGTLYVDPIDLMLPVTCGGIPGAPGAGSFDLPILLTDPGLVGFTFFSQAGFFDGAAVQGISLTNGLRIVMG